MSASVTPNAPYPCRAAYGWDLDRSTSIRDNCDQCVGEENLMVAEGDQGELERLREENARLKDLLTRHDIPWEKRIKPGPISAPEKAHPPAHFSTEEKIELFNRLFRGRRDVYPQRWESTRGRSGYSPACANEWKPGICHKPRVKCSDCGHRQLLPVTYQVIYDHLSGRQTIGVYPLLTNDRCFFLAVDIDEADWREDAKAFMHTCRDLENALLRVSGGRHPLDVAFISEQEESKPWKRPPSANSSISGPLPDSLTLVLANQIFIAKAELPQPLANRLIRLAAFQNPEFYKAQSMRLPVWNKPRIISCAENLSQHVAIPRGCLEAVLDLLHDNQIRPVLRDERLAGQKIKARFTGKLRQDQKAAVEQMLKHEFGVLCAPTAFGKTVTAAALIARRKVSTLVLVHRKELLLQWQERLNGFLDLPKGGLGVVGGGKKKPSGQIDIAVMQSLNRREDRGVFLDQYAQIIVDECHHISAFSFESILKQVKAKFVVGLTATPIRRDGHHPIIFMQCGAIRHTVKKAETVPQKLEVWPKVLPVPKLAPDSPIQEVFRTLATDETRNRHIAKDVLTAYQEGRKVLVLTERTEHLALLQGALGNEIKYCFVLHGRLSRKQRTAIVAELESLDESTPRVLLATGRLIGEGFDHPPLDTLVLAMPISWKGTLQQYAGRLHREHVEKRDVRIYDYAEIDQPQLARMWAKRQQGYRAMGYELKSNMVPTSGQAEGRRK
ncbi:DEAD/DEAH box helicase [Halorhodospira halochloris]|uniref:DEAD/DEAH box helicase n=1 Tax=Halorhodospira halochloris TaxID=1052 RepID=UPI001EE7876C|nr:DEAD/DEAH box helicase [Halorhodospira halochloris]MCG5549399.1 DEAD/DEAH box helicase [Halorhodospira halochloris]